MGFGLNTESASLPAYLYVNMLLSISMQAFCNETEMFFLCSSVLYQATCGNGSGPVWSGMYPYILS